MDYLYENLGDERFQEFCHCIIEKKFPNIQAFPVGQPDGGRDSIVYILDGGKKFIVFQVKYVRNPFKLEDPHKWLIKTMDDEIKKINELIPKGASSYYLLTNVKGTAHKEAGSIDKMNDILDKNIDIPAYCWWRDDISRLLDSNPLLKWSYPEILNGQDILNSIVFSNLNESKQKNESIIKAYITDQYILDSDVKFKQIDLQSHILDLYIDVPIRLKKYNGKDIKIKRAISELVRKRQDFPFEYLDNSDCPTVGAALFLSDPKIQNGVNKILLEGGPGQGKSTISQYICQINRIKLLNKSLELESIPSHLVTAPIRLPIKIDLRDIAYWVEKKNPYTGYISDDYFSKTYSNSLESFIAAHISYHSKISNFNTSDLLSICTYSSILFVFDGFDEIANFEIRHLIIEFINSGITRLSTNTKSIQVIITSRPAAFSNTISFSSEEYPHFELQDIPHYIIIEYVEKWIKARGLELREGKKIQQLVEDKLSLPHFKDLAKSPMQLAILLSLLNTRGESLPDKRTALYDNYIELFFNRESEKDNTIRDNRDLIINIHKYLAWILHSEAESKNNNGRIGIDELNNKLKEYLYKEGHNIEIADKLFNAMKERVCALVSRVQGSFEFEVQPLREYFCAKYLYETSPYSPSGHEKSGTKPDRFDALSRSVYWQNVVRFFSGCFDRGELPMLIEKLEELQLDASLKYTFYPRMLTAQLLSDYVFTQYPKLLNRVVKIITNGLNIGRLLNQNDNYRGGTLEIPYLCGRDEIVKECFDKLRLFPSNDYAYELINVIKNNPTKNIDYWTSYLDELNHDELTLWLEYSYHLRILHKLDDVILLDLLYIESKDIIARIQLILNSKRYGIFENNIILKEFTLNGILNCSLRASAIRYDSCSSLEAISNLLRVFQYISILEYEIKSISLLQFLEERYYFSKKSKKNNKSLLDFDNKDEVDLKISDYISKVKKNLNSEISEWRNSLIHWDSLVENGRQVFGENKIFEILSIVSAGIKSKTEKYENYSDLSNNNLSLCKRVRSARLKSGNFSWWKQQLLNNSNNEFVLLVCLSWVTPRTLVLLLDQISTIVDKLNDQQIQYITSGLISINRISFYKSIHLKYIMQHIENMKISEILIYILSIRFPKDLREKFIFEKFTNYSGESQKILKYRMNYLIKNFLVNDNDLEDLKEIKDIYLSLDRTRFTREREIDYLRRTEKIKTIPYNISKVIMDDCTQYPRSLVYIAEKECRINAEKFQTSIGDIAENDNWFGSDFE